MTTSTNRKIVLTLGIGLLAAGAIYVIRYFATRPKKADGSTDEEVTIQGALTSLYNDLFADKDSGPAVVATNITEQKNAIANDMLYGGLSEQELRKANEMTNLDANNDCLLDGTEKQDYVSKTTGKTYKGIPTQKCIGEALTKGMDVRTYIAQR
jgi:hypothetical protein